MRNSDLAAWATGGLSSERGLRPRRPAPVGGLLPPAPDPRSEHDPHGVLPPVLLERHVALDQAPVDLDPRDSPADAVRVLEHDRLSYRLAAAYYADPRGTQALEKHGWLRVQRDGTIVRPPFTWRELTQAQLDVLFTLVQVSTGDYHTNIRDELELARLFARLESRRESESTDTR